MSVITSVSKRFYSFEELPKIWEELKERDKEELGLLHQMIEDWEKIQNSFDFTENQLDKIDKIEFKRNYIILGKLRTTGHYDQGGIESAIILKVFKFYKQDFNIEMFTKRDLNGPFFYRYFLIKKRRADFLREDELFFNVKIPYDDKTGFDFSELYKKEKDLTETLKII